MIAASERFLPATQQEELKKKERLSECKRQYEIEVATKGPKAIEQTHADFDSAEVANTHTNIYICVK